ncbi:MAG TPA: hypothetical protein VFH38_09155 [Jatrophihabitans sp.]|nr:hypothetical protein [Jatrophihabitans sp.]
MGDVRTLSVPDSLHGLLAARLDSLPPGIRELVGDAAVLGTAFPAEALLAISEQPAETVQAELAELVRREVLEISADPLSPQRGSYRFTQNMLRRVAYDTLSRRDRKARHLVVAAHLRNAFENDEIMEVVARHYLDALAAVPDDPDAGAIRSAAIEVLLRAGERAEESGAPGRAAEDFAAAADLTSQFPEAMNTVGATLWERAATAARTAGDNEKLIAYAERARNIYIEHRRERDAARAQTLLGFGTSLDGHIAQARELLADAVEVLRPSPDADTVTALRELAVLETFDGNPVSTQLTEEALVLGQALDVPDAQLADLVVSRALNYNNRGQYTEAAALYEYGVRLAERVGDTAGHARGLTGLASMKLALDPRAAADAARSAYELGKRLGARRLMAVSLTNVGWAEIFLGDWEAAGRALQAGMHADGLADDDTAASVVATLAALRGELSEGDARTTLTACRASEDPQDRCQALLVDALAAATAGRLDEALDTATEIVDHGQALGLTHELYVFGWTTAVRVAFERGDLPAVEALVARLDAHPVGHVPPLLRAERSLARARLGAARDEADADDDFTDAIAQLRAAGSPYHLAHALLDQAEFRAVTAVGPADLLLAEAAAIADRLRATPLAARAAAARAAADVPAVG